MEGDEMMKAQTIEEKQYLVRFNADTKSHLHVLDDNICLTKCPDKICTIFVQQLFINGEKFGCTLAMKAVMSAAAVALAVRTKTFGGNIHAVVMASSSV